MRCSMSCSRPDFLRACRRRSRNYARQQLARLVAEHPDVFEDVRGEGLMLGLKMRVPNTEFVDALLQAQACSPSARATMSCACCRR